MPFALDASAALAWVLPEESPAAEQLEQELVELRLLDYCRPALERRGLKV